MHADKWEKYWIEAVTNCDQKNYDKATEMFNFAIACMEKEGDTDHPHIYVDRARLNLLLDRNELAIVDLDIALENSKITQKEKSRAAISRMIARSRLNMDQGVLEDLKVFAETTENQLSLEVTKEHVILRNSPDCLCFRHLMTSYFVESGICTSENDIQVLNSGIWLIKRINDCGCNQEQTLDVNNRVVLKANSPQEIDSCRGWCDRMAIAGATWCSKVFKRLDCQSACAIAVYQIQKGCYWCCDGEGFYKRCIKPFENIADYIKAPCDPMWD